MININLTTQKGCPGFHINTSIDDMFLHFQIANGKSNLRPGTFLDQPQ